MKSIGHTLWSILYFAIFLICQTDAVTYLLGNKLIFGNKTLDHAGKRVFCHTRSQVVIDGSIVAFHVYVTNSTNVRLQIWRPKSLNDPKNMDYTLVGQHMYRASEPMGIKLIQLTGEDRIPVKKGDRLCFANEDDTGPITYKFIPDQRNKNPLIVSQEFSDASEMPKLGATLKFDTLILPYQFSISASCDPYALPDIVPGPVGPPGIPGPAGKDVNGNGITAAQVKCLCGQGLLSRDVILGVIIWVLFLTLIVIFVCFILCCIRQKTISSEHLQKQPQHTRYASENGHTLNPKMYGYKANTYPRNGVVVSHAAALDPDHHTMDPLRHRSGETMRAEVTTDYTISRISPNDESSAEDWPT